MRRTTARHQGAGFTVVELIVSVSVVAVLVSLSVPALSGAAAKSVEIRGLAAMRELGTSISVYAQSNKGLYPYMGTPGQPERGVEALNDLVGDGISYNASYFGATSHHWPTLLVREGHDIGPIAQPDPESRTKLAARYGDPSVIGSPFQLTHATAAGSAFWDAPSGAVPRSGPVFSAQGTRDVRYPSRKGLLLALHLGAFDTDANEDQSWVMVGVCDGSARRSEQALLDPGVGTRPFGVLPFPVLSTRGGFDGTDF